MRDWVSSGRAAAKVGVQILFEERYDLVIWRRDYFENPFQTLLRFAASNAFLRRAVEIRGYDISGLGRIRLNGA